MFCNVLHNYHRKQQVFVANRVAQILEKAEVSQWNHVSGIKTSDAIGTRAITVDEIK